MDVMSDGSVTTPRPAAVRVGHLLVIGLMLTAMLCGQQAFDFSSTPRVLTRDQFFALHRAAGLVVGMLVARMLEGRLEEAFALAPAYNLVSRPENDLAYLLLHWHRMIIDGFLTLLGIHVAAALFHAVVLKDRLLSRMFCGRPPT